MNVLFCRAKEVMDVGNRRRSMKRRNDLRRALSVAASVLLPPLGLYLVWNTRWSSKARCCLSGLAVISMVMIVALIPSVSGPAGGIEYVKIKPEVEIYGPDLPTATVTGYIAPVEQSVFVQVDEEDITYVYAITEGTYYHLGDCKYAYASAQKMTPYQAHFMGYQPCPQCGAPEYVPGTIQ